MKTTFAQDSCFPARLNCFIVLGISEAFLNNGSGNSGADTASSSRLLSPPPAASTAATVVPGEADNSLESGECTANTSEIHT
jgi:hypothetical protein